MLWHNSTKKLGVVWRTMNLLRNLSTKAKLLNLVLLMALFLSAVGYMGYYQLNKAEQRLESMYEDQLIVIKSVNAYSTHTRAIEAIVFKMILQENSNKRTEYKQDLEQRIAESNELLVTIEKANLDAEELSILERLKAELEEYQNDRTQVLKLIEEQNADEAFSYFLATEKTLSTINLDLKALVEYNSQVAENSNKQNMADGVVSKIVLLVTVATAVVLAVVIGLLISRMISIPLNQMVISMQELAAGNLGIQPSRYKGKDEVGKLTQAFNKLIANLQGLVEHVKQAGEQVAASSEQLSASAEQTKHASEQITDTIQQVASASDFQVRRTEESVRVIEEMAIGIQRIAETSGVVTEASVTAAQEAEQGNESIQRAIRQMGAINEVVNHSSDVVKQLGERSLQIGQIVEVITGIASQTNLLALNAAIEAARAGEQGRGFAVVADEVRKLAEQSEDSARQISHLIREIQLDTNRAVEAMEQGTNEAETGANVVKEAGDAFQRIVLAAQSVADQIQEVSAATEQMSASIQEVSSSMDEMKSLAQDSSGNTQGIAAASEEQLASMQEMAASSENLSRMAHELQQAISKFTL